MIDRWDSCCDDIQFKKTLRRHRTYVDGQWTMIDQFYDFLIEYKELQETAHFKLEWVSVNTPR